MFVCWKENRRLIYLVAGVAPDTRKEIFHRPLEIFRRAILSLHTSIRGQTVAPFEGRGPEAA